VVDHRRSLFVLACLLMLATGGCIQRIAVNQTIEALDEGAVVMNRESDPAFARQALPSQLKTFEALLVNSPGNDRLLERLAEGYFSYAFGFLEQDLAEAQIALDDQARIDELTDRAIDHYRRARDYGFRRLDNPEFRQAATNLEVDRVEELLAEMDEDDVPGLFWTAYAWGSWINRAQQDPDTVAALPVVERMMRRVVELDASYQDWGAHTFFGVYYASRPEAAGGDPEKAKQHFETALEQAGDRNLMIPFLYGRYYGAQTQNRELFDRMMQKVETADLGEYPDRRLNNELARDRAEFWTEHADELFY
jgi:tetratricopeptide (TPR) repeat protein